MMGDSVPSPKNILRGHKAQVHAATFIRNNDRLITGDADGYVIAWDLAIMRPVAVWRAHENAILGIKSWDCDKLITHGRDNKLIIWKLSREDEERLSNESPLNIAAPPPQPWVLHLLEVNTMNFCSFSACSVDQTGSATRDDAQLLVAVPNTLASEAIDIFQLPSQTRIHTIKPGDKNGMAMCLKLFHKSDRLNLISAFENGFASVQYLDTTTGEWIMTYRSQAHSQPVLSLDVDPGYEYFITSSADSLIVKHPIPASRQEIIETPSTKSANTLADQSALSAGLSGGAGKAKSFSVKTQEWKDPIKAINTKHSGQQSLTVRHDGRIFATAGWDSNVRVYSSKTLKEMAVLQWHNVGAYAVAFASVQTSEDTKPAPAAGSPTNTDSTLTKENSTVVTTVKERRLRKAKETHWVATGSKDGKVALWDIY